jgi:hypothetical protein
MVVTPTIVELVPTLPEVPELELAPPAPTVIVILEPMVTA